MTPNEHAVALAHDLDREFAPLGPELVKLNPAWQRIVADAFRAAAYAERARCAAIARAPREGTWDAYSLAEAIAVEIERGEP